MTHCKIRQTITHKKISFASLNIDRLCYFRTHLKFVSPKMYNAQSFSFHLIRIITHYTVLHHSPLAGE